MRLYLFPITRNRALVYCKRSNIAAAPAAQPKHGGSPSPAHAAATAAQQRAKEKKPSVVERVQARANQTWVKWESAPGGWKKKVTDWGNQAFARIPYEEWGLKSIPPLSRARRAEEEQLARSNPSNEAESARRAAAQVDLVFPDRLLNGADALRALRRLSSPDRARDYRRRIWWSVLAMPLTLPFILVPIVPNMPFFYLVFRAWSYWRAQAGCRHIAHLLDNDLINARPSRLLQRIYDAAPLGAAQVKALQQEVDALRERAKAQNLHTDHPDQEIEDAALQIIGKADKSSEAAASSAVSESSVAEDDKAQPESLLYPKGHGRAVALALNMPELEAELERAHAQVEKALQEEKGVEKGAGGVEKPQSQ